MQCLKRRAIPLAVHSGEPTAPITANGKGFVADFFSFYAFIGRVFADKLVQKNDDRNAREEKEYRGEERCVAGEFLHGCWSGWFMDIYFLRLLLRSKVSSCSAMFFLNARLVMRLRNL